MNWWKYNKEKPPCEDCKDPNSIWMCKHCHRKLKCQCKNYTCKNCLDFYQCKCKPNNGYPCEYCQHKFHYKDKKKCKCKICDFDPRS